VTQGVKRTFEPNRKTRYFLGLGAAKYLKLRPNFGGRMVTKSSPYGSQQK
jgi:hypothetical protein